MEIHLAEKVEKLELSATDEVDNVVKRMKQEGITDIIPFGGGEPCFDTPANIVRAAQRAVEQGKTKYEPTTGDPELRDLIANKFRNENGIPVTSDDIVVTPGGKFAIYLAFQALLSPGDQVMLLDPAWVSYKSMAQMASAGTIHIPSLSVNNFQPDIDLVKKSINPSVKIVVINTPNNPTGAVFDKTTIRQIVELAKANGSLVLCDEVYEYLLYEGQHYSAASEYDNVITVNSFSKSHAMTGWRLGYVTGPQTALEGMIKVYQHSATCVTAFAQAGAIEALKNDESKRASQAMVKGYRDRRDLIVKLLQESKHFDCFNPEGAFYVFPSYKVKMPGLDLANLLLSRAHVATVPGSAFGTCGEGHLRLCYSTSLENIIEGVRRINATLDEI
jgi:aspartate aminotransferase